MEGAEPSSLNFKACPTFEGRRLYAVTPNLTPSRTQKQGTGTLFLYPLWKTNLQLVWELTSYLSVTTYLLNVQALESLVT